MKNINNEVLSFMPRSDLVIRVFQSVQVLVKKKGCIEGYCQDENTVSLFPPVKSFPFISFFLFFF